MDGGENLGRSLAEHRPLLLGLCYRMLGSRADAEDVVQETFARALQKPPKDLTRDLRPWLARVAMNTCRDQLRARKRRPGAWLPSPLPEDALPDHSESVEARYSARESLSVAFLCASRALTTHQRAVLLLRDVFDFSVQETADILETSEGGVKTTLHRARAAMADYENDRALLDSHSAQNIERALAALFLHVQTGNRAALRMLLHEDVAILNDSDDHLFAARKAVVGFDKVLLFLRKTRLQHARSRAGLPRFAFRMLNGEPAIVAHTPSRNPRIPARSVTWIRLDAHGRITHITSQVDPCKLDVCLFEDLPTRNLRGALRAVHAALRALPLRAWVAQAAWHGALGVGRALEARIPRARGSRAG